MNMDDVLYVEGPPDDSGFCSHGQTEEREDGVYCLDCGDYLGTTEEVNDD